MNISSLLRIAALTVPLIFAAGGTHAADAIPLAEDPVVELRLNSISEDLRCLVCQNESLAGSRADLALDLRREIRTLIKDGKSDAQIMDFMVSRYGDFVLYRPPVKPMTWMLWLGPFVLMVAGVIALFVYMRRRNRDIGEVVLTEEERKRAEALLKEGDK